MSTAKRHRRRSIRLPGYDYTQPGAYFITVCSHEHELLFGTVVDGDMQLNGLGEIVRQEWFRTSQLRPYVRLHDEELVVMPNHVHGIIWIADADDVDGADVGAQRRCAPTRTHGGVPSRGVTPTNVVPGSLGAIIRSFKSAVTKRINLIRGTPGAPVWQRNYWEHVIRNEHTLNAIRQYILDNPQRWSLDRYNPCVLGADPMAQEIWAMLRCKEEGGGKP